MLTVSMGYRKPQVKLLQRLINLDRGRRVLTEDGIFGPNTRTAVDSFQTANKLTPDKIVGPLTWKALGVNVEIDHRVALFAQPTNMTCWSAAGTMLFGNRSIGPGGASTGPNGGLGSSFDNVQTFARAHGLVMHAPMSWSVQGIINLMRRNALWVAGTQPLGSPTGTQSGHAVVVGSVWGNGRPDGTMLLIYDPWPPNFGSIYGVFFGDRVASSPLMTTYILHR